MVGGSIKGHDGRGLSPIKTFEKVHLVIKQLGELIKTMEEACSEVSRLLSQGETSRGMQLFSDLTEALQQVKGAFDFLSRAGYAENLGITDVANDLQAIFPIMLSRIEDQDYVALADLLEYEMQPVLAALRKRLTEKALLPN